MAAVGQAFIHASQPSETLRAGALCVVWQVRVQVHSEKRLDKADMSVRFSSSSMDPSTSLRGRVLTRAIVLAADTVHLGTVDHLIVSPDEVFSLRKAGLI